MPFPFARRLPNGSKRCYVPIRLASRPFAGRAPSSPRDAAAPSKRCSSCAKAASTARSSIPRHSIRAASYRSIGGIRARSARMSHSGSHGMGTNAVRSGYSTSPPASACRKRFRTRAMRASLGARTSAAFSTPAIRPAETTALEPTSTRSERRGKTIRASSARAANPKRRSHSRRRPTGGGWSRPSATGGRVPMCTSPIRRVGRCASRRLSKVWKPASTCASRTIRCTCARTKARRVFASLPSIRTGSSVTLGARSCPKRPRCSTRLRSRVTRSPCTISTTSAPTFACAEPTGTSSASRCRPARRCSVGPLARTTMRSTC